MTNQSSKSGLTGIKFWLGLGVGTTVGWVITQQLWVLWQLLNKDVQRTLRTQTNQAPKGFLCKEKAETETYERIHTIEDGIERVVYLPKSRRFKTPILMQHGMWHGAWCWQHWQALLAGWGWESHAFSLPGHAGSPTQRPIPLCTLDYYLSFLKAEVDRLPQRPVLMGHSMGGALTQWYLKHVGNLPAVVLVAPWVSHSTMKDGFWLIFNLDPLSNILSSLSWTSEMVRNPYRAARALITEGALYTPQALHAKLGPESVIVMYQHNPPFWSPPEEVNTPMLWLAGERDAVVDEPSERRSAAYYNADYVMVEEAGHNLMMEHNYRQTAKTIHNWLVEQELV